MSRAPAVPASDDGFRSNVDHWKVMQEEGYFENHPLYTEAINDIDFDCHAIEWFVPLAGVKTAVVIGCGYGRESVHIARRVGHVYGIDVSRTILDKAVEYTRSKGVDNFTPVLAENFVNEIPSGIDLVFSHVVFQHLTRDLARRYMQVLGGKLSPEGAMVIQFCEDFMVDPDADADLRAYEPSVSYTCRQIVEMTGPRLTLRNIRSYLATPTAMWHWAHMSPKPAYPYVDKPPAPGEQRAPLNFASSDHFFRERLPFPGSGVSFSSGATPWNFVASLLVAVDPPLENGAIVAVIEAHEPVHVLLVDAAYQQLGERVTVAADAGLQAVTFPLVPGAAAMVVQADAAPKSMPIILHKAWLQSSRS